MSKGSGLWSPWLSQKRWWPLAAVGLLAVVGGIVAPRLISSDAVQPVPAQIPGKPAKQGKDALVYTPPQWPEAPDPKAMLLRLALGTAFVLALCVGSLWVGKRWLKKLPTTAAGTGQMTVVETLNLGNRCCMHLVKVGARQVLVGTDGSGLTTIAPLPETFDSTMQELEADASRQSVPESAASDVAGI
jgi:flagellar biogenesis protein FliO